MSNISEDVQKRFNEDEETHKRFVRCLQHCSNNSVVNVIRELESHPELIMRKIQLRDFEEKIATCFESLQSTLNKEIEASRKKDTESIIEFRRLEELWWSIYQDLLIENSKFDKRLIKSEVQDA